MADDNDLLLADDADDFAVGREEESLFARDDNDTLVRKERETQERFRDLVTVVIDGFPVEIPRAVPKTDARGNPLRDPDGGLQPRTTTIYDAAAQLVSLGVWTDADLKDRIPVLCHQQHLTPVAVCRVCSVHISSVKKGKLTPGRKLVPACQHRVEKDMVVTTRAGADGYNPEVKPTKTPDELKAVTGFAKTVNDSVSVVAELLLADCRHPALTASPTVPNKFVDGRYANELEAVAGTLKVVGPRARIPRATEADGKNTRFATHARSRKFELPLANPTAVEPEQLSDRTARTAWTDWNRMIDEEFPYSSRTVVVDHDRCIVCDRCVRSCSEVKPFKVIGHTGRGYDTRISFDLDQLMGQSSCVQCGECMTSCPTGALSVRRRVQPRAWEDSPEQIPLNPNTPFPPGSGFLSADEMLGVKLEYTDPVSGANRVFWPFRQIPFAYLKWNEGAVRRWEIPAGESKTLCEIDTYGSTAFLLETGTFNIYAAEGGGNNGAAEKPGLLARLFGGGGSKAKLGRPFALDHNELILGEMACLTAQKRNRKIEAAGPAVWYEVTRNMLDLLQRNPDVREQLDRLYTRRAIFNCLSDSDLFRGVLPADRAAATKFLQRVNDPTAWVGERSAAEVAQLWEGLLRPDRTGPGEPVTGLGYLQREELAKALDTAAADFGFTTDEGRKQADAIRSRKVAEVLAALPADRAGRACRALAGPAADAWFPTPTDPRYKAVLTFLVLPSGRAERSPPPADIQRAALEMTLLLNPIQLLRVDADQGIVSQNETASDFYMVRLGFVRVQTEVAGRALPVAQLGANAAFGELALLARHPELGGASAKRERTTSVVATDPVEVVRVRGPVFYLMCAHVPGVETGLVARGKSFRPVPGAKPQPLAVAKSELLPDYLGQGLYQSQKMLVLDLATCTRCDECTRACADSHEDGHARLLREGFRFGDFLVATSCRSCHTPYCMTGCPVDAIHRRGNHLEVVIEDHCIGCSLCERNCPYGSIQMVPKLTGAADVALEQFAQGDRQGGPPTPTGIKAAARRAVNCDLCGDTGGVPFCVEACPHDAAFRWDGPALMNEVAARAAKA